MFIVPKSDEDYASEKLAELNELYPNRKLKIVGVSDLGDILDRRNLIQISKQNLVMRILKSSRKNWQVTILLIVLYILTSFALLRGFDDNPTILDNEGKVLLVKNSVGRVLWTKDINYNSRFSNSNNYLNYLQKIVDVNNDGKNEVLISMDRPKFISASENFGELICFDKEGQKIWNYIFNDTVATSAGTIQPEYDLRMIDTFSVNNKKYLLAMANNKASCSSCIYKLDLTTGRRVKGTLWNSGIITNAFINDINNDGSNEIIFTAVNKAFQKIAVGELKIRKLNGQCPSGKEYSFINIPKAKLMQYILLPKTDLCSFMKNENPISYPGSLTLNPNDNCILIRNLENANPPAAIVFEINEKSGKIKIRVDDALKTQRDSLINAGFLNPPFTNTAEFLKILQNNFLFWQGNEFKNFTKTNFTIN